jgi:hypothetical protein
MKRKAYIKELARRTIELTMGDKVNLGDTDKDKKIEIDNRDQNNEKNIIKVPLSTRIYNALSTTIIVFALMIGLIIPLVVSLKFTTEVTKDIYYLMQTRMSFGVFIRSLFPIMRFYIMNFGFTLIVAAIALVIILLLTLARHLFSVIEYRILEKSIKNNTENIQETLKKMDKADE